MGVDVNVTGVPVQTGFADATVVRLTGNNGSTVMVMVLDGAGLPVMQASADETVHWTIIPFNGTNEYVELVAPATSSPLTCHW